MYLKKMLIGISSKVKCISVTIIPHKVRIDIIISLLSIILKIKTTCGAAAMIDSD